MRQVEKATVFFDNECLICTKAKEIIQTLDKNNFIKFVDLRQANNLKGVKPSSLIKEIHLITERREIYKGYFAIKYILLRLPILMPLRVIINQVFMDKVGILLYKVISRNRLKPLVCQNCNL